MNFEDMELDVSALQQLPETDPVGVDGVAFGGDSCLLTSCSVLATECSVVALTG